jgi:hypothetical protein
MKPGVAKMSVRARRPAPRRGATRLIKIRPRHPSDDLWNGHDDYFAGPIPPVDHARALKETAWLTKVQLGMWLEGFVEVEPKQLIRVLNRAGVKFVLMGAHVTNAWSRVARATRDVDVLVQKSHHRKAVQAIQKAFPTLIPEEHPVVTRFRDPADNQVAIDVMKPSHEIHKAALKHTVRVQGTHQVPILEMLLACKFAAMVSPNRPRDRAAQDAADFGLVVRHNKEDINRDRLARFGEIVYEGGGSGVLKLLDDFLAGRPIVV